MGELEKHGIYACALSMPSPDDPRREEWIEEIARHVERNKNDEIYLVGHSLGAPAVLCYLEMVERPIRGAVLVSGPAEKTDNEKVNRFFETPFDYENIRRKSAAFAVIHGDEDPIVPLSDANTLRDNLKAELFVVKGGKHLNGSSGCFVLPECLTALLNM